MHPKHIAFFYAIVPVLCLALYLHGFFPLKATLPGHAELKNFSFNGKTVVQPSPMFDKLVIILIDALRSDFVLKGNSMTHLGETMLNNGGVNFEVRAHPPTVTLPRIKAITTGTIPGFIDVVLNFDSSALEEDNIVTQMKRASKRMVFYGDDTWLKLFPDHFVRSDGTTSFFVSDYTQVDNNVTRHLNTELTDMDWDMMILHYLGLDHIGHLEGPHSPLVGPKLQEMDEIIHRVYKALEKQSDRSIILVCGDHGMSDHGGHGGASESEILVPAVFISPQFKNKAKAALGKPNRSLMQTDIASTLSVLMGLPITNNNLGQVLQEVLAAAGADVETMLEILYFNTQQVVQLMKANIPSYKHEASYKMFLDVSKLHSEYLNQEDKDNTEVNARQLLYLYETTLEALTARISSSLTRYDMYQLVVAPVVMLLAFVAVILMSQKVNISQTLSMAVPSFTLLSIPLASYTIWHVIVCSSHMFYSSTMCSWGTEAVLWHLVTLMMIIGSMSSIKVLYKMDSNPSKDVWPKTGVTKLLLLGTILHSLTYVSSSNIEEEHQTCYFLVTTFFCVNTVRTLMVYLRQAWILKHTVTCACGEIKYTKGITKDSGSELYSGLSSKDDEVVERFFNEIDKLRKDFDVSEENRHRPSLVDQTTELSRHSKSDFGVSKDTEPVTSLSEGDAKSEVGGGKKKEDSKDTTNYYSTKLEFPLKELISLVVILVILRFLRSLNQTGNKWLDRPDVGDWLGRSENRLVMSIVVIAAMILLWAVIGIKHSFTEMLMVGIAMLSCYRHRAKTGAIQDFLNQITIVDKKSVGTIQFMIVYGIGGLLIFRNVLDLISYKMIGQKDEKKKAKIMKNLVESVQESLLMMMAIVLRTHNILYVVGVAFIEILMEVNLGSITSLPVPYLTMICLWMGRASFFYQGNSNSLSSIDVAAGYAGHPHYQATIVTIQLFVTTYAGPIFWFIVLLKYIYLQSQCCDTGTESPGSKLKTSLFLSVMTLVLERLFTLLLYTTVTTMERYHLFVWTVFSPKLLYEGMFTLLSAMVSLIFLCLQ